MVTIIRDDGAEIYETKGGITVTPAVKGDPYEILDDMMAVVEALCPRWPPRSTFKAGGHWLL